MGLKGTLANLLLAAPLALAHPHPGGGREKVYHHAAVPVHQRNLNHCTKRFEEEEFVKRTTAKHSDEFMKLRRAIGKEAEDRYASSRV